jgi:uncharacterized repeat protein (TIGR01451 family)
MTTRTRLSRIPLGACALLVCLTAGWLPGVTPAAAQTAADSSAFGESASLSVLPLLGSGIQVTSGPLPQVAGSAPAAYAKSGSALSASVSTALTGSILQTGVLSVSASSQVPAAVHTAGGAVTNQVALDLGHVLPLLTLDADVVQSAAAVDGTCGSSLVATGSADLANAVAGGSLGLGLTVASHPGPNTVLLDIAGVKIVLNEQFTTGNGTTSRGLTVNAVHVYLQNALLSGLGVLSGDIVISQSHANVQCGAAPPAAADLALAGSDSPDPVASGGTLHYSLTVTNQGPDAATGVVLTGALGAGLAGVSATPSQGSCSAGPPVACNLGTIGAGQSAQVTVAATVTAGPGTLVTTASVASGVFDPSSANNSVTLSTEVVEGKPREKSACRIDAAPAATLLIPYFAVDLDHPQGVTTVFTVTNALALPQLAHVVLWTDWAVPTLTFDLYLTGYDVESVDLRDLLGRGLVPTTGAAVSHLGDISEPNVTFAGCGASTAKALPLWLRRHLRAEHTGRRSASTGNCAGSRQANASVAVGYLTIDAVRACTSSSPADPGYFVDGGGGIATNQNALLGEYFIVDPSLNQIDADLAVHLQADADAFGPGRYTFYSRYSNGGDNRQPLGQAYAVPYTDAAPFPDGTQLIVWRDTKSPDKAMKACGAEPSWAPLAQSGVLAFDRQENSTLLPAEAQPFPMATQLVTVGGSTLPMSDHSGWLLLDLGHAAASQLGPKAQAWVTVRHSSLGHFTMSTRAFRLDDLCGAQ